MLKSAAKRKGCLKWICGFLCVPVLILLLGALPAFEQHESGLESFDPEDSTMGLCQNLYPSEDFLERFPYIQGDYWYDYNGILLDSHGIAFSVLTYDPQQYARAREFCFQQFTNVDAHQYQVGDYHFVEHLCHRSKNDAGKYEISCEYPEIFNMFAYNDSLCTLLFLGYFEPNGDEETLLALRDFESFYDLCFSGYYELKK